jgi:5-methyltetrahydropteroyltriglutamate--homocysteine methyltransferase
MFIASRDKPLLTTITGSLPRPNWFQSSLNGRVFSTAMSDLIFREQYTDTLCTYVTDQARAGIDLLTDGDARFDMDVGGRAWFSYMFERMGGMGNAGLRPQPWTSKREETPGDILHEVNETRLPAIAHGDVTRGDLEYARIWKAAQRLTTRPVKIGTCCGQLLEAVVINKHYPNRRELCLAIARAMNQEYHELADAGCPVIQLEEPLMHYVAEAKGLELDIDFYVQAFNIEVAGLRKKTEVWVHTCWGNPAAQKVEVHTDYRPALPYLAQLDADVITFETASDDGEALPEIGKVIGKDKKICIGVVNHRTLQVETPDQVAALIRKAIKYIEPERLILSTDCGFGRQGMSRLHAFYKMVSIVQGANLIKRELGFQEAPCLAADPRFSFL